MAFRLAATSLLLGTVIAGVNGFQFTINTLTECGAMTVNWSGGTPPYNLLLIPAGQTFRNLSIPSTSVGSFSTQITFPQGQTILVAMSDATGVTAGGISDVLTVGVAQPGAACSTTGPTSDFIYFLESPLVQCADYPFTGFDQAFKPVTIYGFAAKGTSFTIQSPQAATSVVWNANYAAGTQMAFFMTDAQGRNGGVSQIQTVGASSNTTCLTTSSAGSTTSTKATSSANDSSKTSTASSGTSSDSAERGSKSGGSNTGIIIGAVAGGFVFLGILAFLVVFCFKRKKSQGATPLEPKLDLSYDPTVNSSAAPPSTYLLPSSYSHSNANLTGNLTGNQPASYAQNSQSSQGSQGYAPTVLSTTPLNPTADVQVTDGRDFSPYAAQQGGANSFGYAQGGANAAGGTQNSGYGAGTVGTGVVAGAAAEADAASHDYYQQHYSQRQYQQYPQQGYQQQQYPQQYPHQYQQQYQQQYPSYQQYSPAGHAQAPPSQGGGNSSFYTTNADPRETYDGYAYPPAPQPKTKHKATTSGGSAGNVGGQSRLVVHQDIEDTLDLPEELPPQYSEARAPIPGLPSSQLLRDRKG